MWSNRYHFSGGIPPDLSHFTTLAGNVKTAEALSQPTWVTFVSAIYYGPDSDVPVYTVALSGTGSQVNSGSTFEAPGDAAALVRFSTDQRSTKNHPIYLFNYYHGAICDPAAGHDLLGATYKSALTTYANAWITGFSDGASTYHRGGPRGAVALGCSVNQYVTHRDFPR